MTPTREWKLLRTNPVPEEVKYVWYVYFDMVSPEGCTGFTTPGVMDTSYYKNRECYWTPVLDTCPDYSELVKK